MSHRSGVRSANLIKPGMNSLPFSSLTSPPSPPPNPWKISSAGDLMACTILSSWLKLHSSGSQLKKLGIILLGSSVREDGPEVPALTQTQSSASKISVRYDQHFSFLQGFHTVANKYSTNTQICVHRRHTWIKKFHDFCRFSSGLKISQMCGSPVVYSGQKRTQSKFFIG